MVKYLFLGFLIACGGNRHLDAIDHRLHDVEVAQQDEQKQLAEIQLELAALKALAASGNLADEIEQLSGAIDQLQKQVKMPAPTPQPRVPDPAEPDPDAVYAVTVDGAPSRGPADALVTIVRATDYACPYCEKSRTTMDDLLAKYPKELRIVYRSLIVHPSQATLPAEAACAANLQGKFFPMDDKLWDEAFPARAWDQAEMDKLAGEVGLDLDRFHADMSGACVKQIGADQAELNHFGAVATPSFFINGRYMSGAYPATYFEPLIESELALAQKRVKAGTKRKKYYATWIVGKGKTSR